MSWVVRKDKAASHDRRKPKKDRTKHRAISQTPAPTDKKIAPATTKRVSLRINEIVIKSNRRKIDKAAVLGIAGTMKEIGQQEPIIVRKETMGVHKKTTALVLVDGGHRVEAAKGLGWKKIEAVYFEGDEEAARVYELTQALTAAGITVLDRAKFLTELVGRVLGESRAKELQRGGRQPGDKGISKTARELGYPRDDIRRGMLIASMSETAMAMAVKLGLDDNESALLKIAKAKWNEQVAVAEQEAAKKNGGKKGPNKPKLTKKDQTSFAKLMDVWEDGVGGAFREATANARQKFVSMLKRVLAQLAKAEDAGGTSEGPPVKDRQDEDDDDSGDGDEEDDNDDEEDEEE
jgi:ParB-like chromosome segregation protein Spo0J